MAITREDVIKLIEEKGKLSRVNLVNLDLSGLCLDNLSMSHVTFTDCNLSHAVVSWYKTTNSLKFTRCNLEQAIFTHTDGYCIFRSCNLVKTVFNYTNLVGFVFYESPLKETLITNCEGNRRNIFSLQTPIYDVNIYEGIMSIGCEVHSIDDWFDFNYSQIHDMGGSTATDFWETWKTVLSIHTSAIKEYAEE